MKGFNLLLSALLLISGTCAIEAGVVEKLASVKERGAQVWGNIPSLQDIKTACELNKIKGQLGSIPTNSWKYIKSNQKKTGLIALASCAALFVLWKLLPKKARAAKRQKQANL
jgi:hypothetical protein